MDTDVTRHLALPAGDHIAHLIEAAQGAGDLLGQAFALYRQADATRAALNQGGAKEVFQVLDLPADGSGRDVQTLGRLTQGGATRHLVKIPQGS